MSAVPSAVSVVVGGDISRQVHGSLGAVKVGHAWTAGMMSSIRQDWGTPDQLFHFLDQEFRFTIDLCADASNAKCDRWYGVEQDSLRQDWFGVCWLNPPYGRNIGTWIRKAYLSAVQLGSTVACLLPARTDTSWWHDYCLRGEIRFLRGRLRFDNNRTRRCPFPSAIVIFRPLIALRESAEVGK